MEDTAAMRSESIAPAAAAAAAAAAEESDATGCIGYVVRTEKEFLEECDETKWVCL